LNFTAHTQICLALSGSLPKKLVVHDRPSLDYLISVKPRFRELHDATNVISIRALAAAISARAIPDDRNLQSHKKEMAIARSVLVVPSVPDRSHALG
jgi:hypothetical protein